MLGMLGKRHGVISRRLTVDKLLETRVTECLEISVGTAARDDSGGQAGRRRKSTQ
jgi:hypothetical protein